ncbi:CUB and zona pellucida-like domain-containing protein 1 isoform X2 [Mytilus edulis]|uniref:CUB and zona pellucida-like domain-containing protein 1 isoform X2 n=1 Tax=Mytilus edulis TaxID=6550 RepID=UPI0039F02280
MKFLFVLAIFIVCAGAVTIHQVKNTRQCKAEGGICKQTCAVDEEDTGPCCRNSYRCCQPSCNDTLQYAECNAKNGKSKPVCDVNEQDTGIGPFCNTNRCCEPPTCIVTCGGSFKGPEGSFTSPNYPSDYCDNQICNYTIIVEEGSKVMFNFTFVKTENKFLGALTDTVQVYDGEISTDTLLATLYGGPFEGLEFNSTSNKMITVFKSDYSVVFPGFSAIYKSLQ